MTELEEWTGYINGTLAHILRTLTNIMDVFEILETRISDLERAYAAKEEGKECHTQIQS